MTSHPVSRLWWAAVLAVFLGALPSSLSAQTKKPNILVIFGDDIGQSQVSAYETARRLESEEPCDELSWTALDVVFVHVNFRWSQLEHTTSLRSFGFEPGGFQLSADKCKVLDVRAKPYSLKQGCNATDPN